MVPISTRRLAGLHPAGCPGGLVCFHGLQLAAQVGGITCDQDADVPPIAGPADRCPHVEVAGVLDLPPFAVVVYQCGDLGGLCGMIVHSQGWRSPSATVVAVDDQDPRIYVRIAAGIRAQIEADELKPGQPAPSITVLCHEWGVARETAAHALQVLEAEGLVRRYPGRGYYVVPR
jgi:Bacterial regulatory proteins, gntR family